MTSDRWAGLGIATAAGVLAVLAALIAFAERAPEAAGAHAIAEVLPLAGPHIDAAQRAAAERRFNAAGRELDRAAAIAPNRTGTWLMKAELAALRGPGAFAADGLAALELSYSLAPISALYGPDRLTFAYSRWRELNPDVRHAASREFACLWAIDPSIDSLPGRVADPTGRFAASLDLAAARASNPPSLCHVKKA